MQDALIIFVKNPVIGKVKTRLAKSIGQQEAMNVYLRLLDYTRQSVKNVNASIYIYYSDRIETGDLWPTATHNKALQSGSDLGERMLNAFEEVLKQHSKAVLIGSDCPEINAEIINAAINSLSTHDCCIGPSHDGGYYLIGMKKAYPPLFRNIEWSQPSVYQYTIRKMASSRLSRHELPILHDLDDQEDLDRFPAFK